MKKLISIILTVVLAMSMLTFSSVYADDGIKVTIDGKAQTYDVMPVIVDSRTLVPMRGIFEALGAEIAWDDATKTVTGKKGDVTVELQIGNTVAKLNGKDITLDVPATIVSDRTMVPVRFISESLGCSVDWIGDTKTVVISSKGKLAPLVSTFHRNVPTQFEKSSDMNDMIYFSNVDKEEMNKKYEEIKALGEVVCTTDEFVEGLIPLNDTYKKYGSFEVVDVEGETFNKALRITCTEVPEKSSNFIVKTKATPERNPGDGVKAEDVMLLAFRMRTVSGGDGSGGGRVQFQIEHPETYKKSLFDNAFSTNEWQIVYLPFGGRENATAIGIRPGFYEQVVEIGGIEIINMGPNFDKSLLPQTSAEFTELKEGAPWRQEALDRIEKIRKGDFTVVVKDKDGNVIPDADVELDMFEHQFEFGTCIRTSHIAGNEDYRKTLSENFNAAVSETNMKWAPYVNDPTKCKTEVTNAKDLGIKYYRGHVLIWEKLLGTNKTSYMTPPEIFEDAVLKNPEVFDQKCKEHIFKITQDLKDYVTEWDVANELMLYDHFTSIHGDEAVAKWFKWARESLGEDAELYYNEADDVWTDAYLKRVDGLVELETDFDGLGLHSHYGGDLKMPTEQIALYDKLAERYGKRLKITEFSCDKSGEAVTANFLRDTMIAAFAEENMDGFLFWGFWDKVVYAEISPLFKDDWSKRMGGEVYQDLVYNKWWTRDAKAKTDKDGKAVIRGFYGDYDVTVNANGKTVTDMVAFHSGYENVLEITVE